MKFRWKRILLWVLLAIVALFAIQTVRYWDTIQRVFLGGVKVYETTPPAIPSDLKRPAILVFSKTNGFRHEEAIPAGNALFTDMAQKNGWGIFKTENGATFSPEILSRFDAVVFNNTSGDVFTPDQRQAFQGFLENGGGFVGIHAAGDSSHEAWKWYTDELIGTHFTQHTMKPQFQKATVKIEDAAHPATKGLPSSWDRTEEWYSFDKSPRGGGAHILATVDEKTYNPEGMFGKDLRMGDHPAVWTRCVGKGRVLYSIMGHQASAFAEPEYRQLLQGALNWVMRKEGEGCDPAPAAAATSDAKP
jgi:type 1 glutamine amidotransferase